MFMVILRSSYGITNLVIGTDGTGDDGSLGLAKKKIWESVFGSMYSCERIAATYLEIFELEVRNTSKLRSM